MSKIKHRYSGVDAVNLCKSHGGKSERELTTSFLLKLSRKELEDRFATTFENNIALKQQINKKDEKLKLMGTKLLRITEQLRRESSNSEPIYTLEKVLDEQSLRIETLQSENNALNEKVNILKRQIFSQKFMINSAKVYTNRKSNDSQKPMSKSRLDSYEADYLYEKGETNPEEKHIPQINSEIERPGSNLHEKHEESSNDFEIVDNITYKQKTSNENPQINNKTRNSFSLKDSSSYKKPGITAKDIEIQTSIEEIANNTKENSLNEKLAQEHLLVLDLQQQLKTAQLTQRVVDQVEELLKTLNSKNQLEKRDFSSKNEKFEEPESIILLRQELQKEKIELQAQKTMNDSLLVKLSEMQKELDNLNVKFRRSSSLSKRIVSNKPRPSIKSNKYEAIGKSDIYEPQSETAPTKSEKKSHATQQRSYVKGEKSPLPSFSTTSSLITPITSRETSVTTSRNNNGKKDFSEKSNLKEKEIILGEDIENDAQTLSQVKDEQINSSIQKTDIEDEDMKSDESFDDGTYDISKDISDSDETNKSSVLSYHDPTISELSDGEIPKKKKSKLLALEEEKINTGSHTLSDPNIEAQILKKTNEPEELTLTPQSLHDKVKITLQAISVELNRCNDLLCPNGCKDCNCSSSKSTFLVQNESSLVPGDNVLQTPVKSTYPALEKDNLNDRKNALEQSLTTNKGQQERKNTSEDISSIKEEVVSTDSVLASIHKDEDSAVPANIKTVPEKIQEIPEDCVHNNAGCEMKSDGCEVYEDQDKQEAITSNVAQNLNTAETIEPNQASESNNV